MNDVTSIKDTIKPKSDQLNADDLITGPIDVTVTGVRRGSADQPIIIDIAGNEPLMPFKPCKTVRRVLIAAWGDNGNDWAGKSMTLYNDPSVKWAGVAIGGIRVSRVSGITQPMNIMLTTTRGKRSEQTIAPLSLDFSEDIKLYSETPEGAERDALWASLTPIKQAAIHAAFSG